MTTQEKLAQLAPNLAAEFPRSPREKLGRFVVAARTLDKCRATLAGQNGEYHFDCLLDSFLFSFARITADEFRAQTATGADDAEMAAWLDEKTKDLQEIDIIKWNNLMREKRISELPDGAQEYLEGLLPEIAPPHQAVYCWFDVYDIEEKRI